MHKRGKKKKRLVQNNALLFEACYEIPFVYIPSAILKFNHNWLFSIYKKVSKAMQITDISLLPQLSATLEAIMQFNSSETISDNILYDASSIR